MVWLKINKKKNQIDQELTMKHLYTNLCGQIFGVILYTAYRQFISGPIMTGYSGPDNFNRSSDMPK